MTRRWHLYEEEVPHLIAALRHWSETTVGVPLEPTDDRPRLTVDFPAGFPSVYEPGGVPPGWEWLTTLGPGAEVIRADTGEYLVFTYTPERTRGARLSWGQVFASVGILAEVTVRSKLKGDQWRTALNEILSRCPIDPESAVTAHIEVTLAALAGTVWIPPSAYDQDMKLAPRPLDMSDTPR